MVVFYFRPPLTLALPITLLLTLLACCPHPGHGLDNGLGRLPGLGWNSDYCANCSKDANGFQNEVFIKHIADFIHAAVLPCGKTFQQLGYHYVNMDASWNTKYRDANGDLVPDPLLWPSGFNVSVDYVHSLGLGFGIYGDRGTKDCAGNPGAQGYETKDAQFMARNKIDWYKEDSCFAPMDVDSSIKQYQTMRDALNATGHQIWFALCGWETYYSSDPRGGNNIGNSARVGPDTGQGWVAVMTNIEAGLSVTQFAGPKGSGGFWNDGSLQLTPGILNSGLPQDDAHNITDVRHRSQFSAWSMLAMNILMTGNLSALNPYVIETWSNAEVLAVHQDPLGRAGFLLARYPGTNSTGTALLYTVAGVSECGGEPSLQVWLLNRPAAEFIYNPATQACLNVNNCGTQVIYDGCNTNGTSCGGGHGSFHPNEQWVLTPAGQVQSLLPGSPCLTLNSDNTVSVAKCASPVPTGQKWTYNNITNQLITGSGLCLTATGAPAPVTYDSLIIGRQLSGNTLALMFLNNEHVPQTMTCGPACMASLGAQPGVRYTVRDLWLHETVATDITTSTGFTTVVAPGGASNVVSLVPQQ